jgi:hypothetical protein
MSSVYVTFDPNYTPQRLCVFALCLVLTVIPACAQTNEQIYFPLAAGSTWTYTGYFSSADNKPHALHGTARVEGKTLIHGKEYFKYVLSAEFADLPGAPKLHDDVRYYRVAQDGIYFLSARNPDGLEGLELPLPVPLNVKWLNGTVEARAERAGTIQAGTRTYANCLKVTYQAPAGAQQVEYYLAPRVGVVRAIYTDMTPPKSVMELTLVEYRQ